MSESALRALERIQTEFGPDRAARRLALLRTLERARLPSARAVERVHEALCFARAYPDDRAVLAQAERMLRAFARRGDAKRHAEALADSGIAGCSISYAFYAATALRLATRWPDRLHIDWDALDDDALERLDAVLSPLGLYAETPGLDEIDLGARAWLAELAGRATDATFLVRRLAEVHRDPFVFERVIEAIDPMLRLDAGKGTPSRTTARAPVDAIAFQRGPLRRARPELRTVVLEAPRAVRELTPAEGAEYVELARNAMLTRQRDLDAFAYGDARDVRVIDWEDGLQFAVIGVIPERRLMLEAVYAFLTLKNGMPIGYVLNSALFGSAEIAYNVFETYRGGEAAHVYGRVLATVRHVFGVDAFTIYPYQLGHHNEEGLRSGAWWFYQKLGFRARDRKVLATMRRELARMRARPAHRSSIATLRALAGENVYWYLGAARDDVIGALPLSGVGLAVTRMLGKRYGPERARGASECAAVAAKLLGLRSAAALPPGERLSFERWAPLIAVLPGVARWSAAERRALFDVMRKKGGRRESDFVRAFDAHAKLRAAVRELAERTS